MRKPALRLNAGLRVGVIPGQAAAPFPRRGTASESAQVNVAATLRVGGGHSALEKELAEEGVAQVQPAAVLPQ